MVLIKDIILKSEATKSRSVLLNLFLILAFTILNLSVIAQENATFCENFFLQNNDSCVGYYIIHPYPNPFSPVTNVQFGIPDSSKISIEILDDSKRMILEIRDCILKNGNYFYDYSDIYLNGSGKFIMKLNAVSIRKNKEMKFEACLELFVLK